MTSSSTKPRIKGYFISVGLLFLAGGFFHKLAWLACIGGGLLILSGLAIINTRTAFALAGIGIICTLKSSRWLRTC